MINMELNYQGLNVKVVVHIPMLSKNGITERRDRMKVFYFKDQSIEDDLRDIDSGVAETDQSGKTTKADYLSIQLKVPKHLCNINFQGMARWTTLHLTEKNEETLIVQPEDQKKIEEIANQKVRLILKEILESGHMHMLDMFEKYLNNSPNGGQ